MRRKQFIFLVIVVLALLSIVATTNFRRWMIEGVEELHRTELELVTDRVATGIEAHLSRVSRGVEVVVENSQVEEPGSINAMVRGFAALRQIFPEVGEMLWLENKGKLYRMGSNGVMKPVGLSVEDLRRDDLEPFLDLPPESHIKLGVIEVPREPRFGDSPLEFKQMILFGHPMRGPDGSDGAVLVPYGLASLVNEYLEVVSEGVGFELALLDDDGELIYSSWDKSLGEKELPFYPSKYWEGSMKWLVDRVVLGDPAVVKEALLKRESVFCAIELMGATPDEQPYEMGTRLTPITIGNSSWTLLVATEHGQLSPTENALFLTTLLGGASLLTGLMAASAFFLIRYHRQARRHLQFESAIELSRSAILVLDAKGECIFANRASRELTGGSPESIFSDEPGVKSHADELANASGDPEASSKVGWQGIRKFINKRSGEEVITSVMTSPVYDEGKYVGLIAIQRDITEEERVKEELEEYSLQLKESTAELVSTNIQLEKDIAARRRAEEETDLMSRQLRRSRTMEAVGQLAGGVAHDFNNVLGAILACLYTLRKAAGDKPELSTEVGHIRDLCKRGGELTRQLLGLGRRSVAGVGPISIVELLESLKVLLARTLPSSIEFKMEFDRSLPSVLGNRANLLTTCLNLALNARDAMPDGGKLRIVALYDKDEEEGRAVKVVFEDNGCGIPVSLHEKIFEPFFTTKGVGVGTGLGLSTAYAAVSEAGGDLTVESVPDKGTVMTVYLKAITAQPAFNAGAVGPMSGGHPFTGGYILVVEDMDEIATMVGSALGSNGYRTILSRTGVDALAQLRDRRSETSAVLLDVVLPDLGGLDVHRYIKRLAPEIPVLFITGREDLLDGVEEELQVVLKPFDEKDLLTALEKLLTQ